MAKWQHRAGEGKWHDFPADQVASLEAAFAAKAATIKNVVAGKSYTIDFGEMTQVCDTDAKRVRSIRRLAPTAASAAGSGGIGGAVKRSAPATDEAPPAKKPRGAAAPVIWQYKGPNHWHNFMEDTVAAVDEAFKAGETSATFTAGGGEYVVDFREMKQHPAKNPAQCRLVRRIGSTDRIAEALVAASAPPPDGTPVGCEKIPMRWSKMEGADANYCEVELLKNPEHNVECSAVVACFTKTTKKKVVSVKRIQNVRLWRMYADQRELVMGKTCNNGKANEHFLWHGSSTSSAGKGAADIIKKSGFESQFSNCAPAGIWLSTNSQYSAGGYAEKCPEGSLLFLVRTTLGYISVDDGSGRRPKKVGLEFADSHHCGASSTGHKRVDDQEGGGGDNRYVVYNNHQLYPAYIVTFK